MAQVSMPEHVLQVGKAQLAAWGPSETLEVVGKSLPKRPGVDKVTGRARYAFDVQLPGMLYGAIMRSTEARARVVAIDTNEVTKIPGVRTIVTPQNFPTLPSQGRPALSDQVRFVGEEIAAVAADTEYAAQEAARAMKVRYEKYHAVIELEAALRPSAPQLTPTGNMGGGGPEMYERGSLQQGEAEADVVYEQRYATEVQHHNPLEPHGCVEVDAITGQVRVLRAVCAHDSGRWVNPLLAESQIQGGFLQGMGMALYEERIMDARLGMMLNNSMHEYFVPTILDTPDQLITLDAQTLDQSNSINVKGLGESPLVGAGAAIANAIYNAIGVRIRHYPITPNKILTALHHPTAAGVSLREQ